MRLSRSVRGCTLRTLSGKMNFNVIIFQCGWYRGILDRIEVVISPWKNKCSSRAFLIYDKKLIVYSEKYMEAKSGDEIEIGEDTDYEYDDKSGWLFGSCKIEQGKYAGEYTASNGSKKVFIPKLNFTVGNKSDANRYAKNMLRYANKNAYTGYFYSSILTGYAPASIGNISNERAPSWDGKVFFTHVRNDYAKGKSKIYFRKPLEGY